MVKYSPEQLAEAGKIAEICKGSFLEFILYFLKPHLVCKIAPFHQEIVKALEGSQRYVCAAPRGHAKSYFISFFYPLWLALFEKGNDITIISASESLAVEWVRKIRKELEQNPLILAFWGDMKSDKWTENHIILKNGVHIRAKGAGGQIRGFRPSHLIIDDLETQESANSEDLRRKNKEWLLKDCINTLLPTGQLIMLGTLYNNVCVLADFLEMDNGWTKKKYQAYYNGIQEAGYELWTSQWSHDKLQARKKEIGSWAFSAEYMNDPVSDESAPIKPEMIKYWKELPQQLSMVISIDPAYTDDDTSDYKVASLIGIDSNYNRYLVRYIRTHEPSQQFINAVLTMWQQNRGNITSVGVPAQGVERAFFDSIVKRATEKNMFPPFVELKNQTTTASGHSVRNKKARIICALQGLFEQGKYYIHADHVVARDELLTIGNSRWDDVCDTLAYAEQVLQPRFTDIVYTNSEGYNSFNEGVPTNYGME